MSMKNEIDDIDKCIIIYCIFYELILFIVFKGEFRYSVM